MRLLFAILVSVATVFAASPRNGGYNTATRFLHVWSQDDVATQRNFLNIDIFGSTNLPVEVGTLAATNSPAYMGLTNLAACYRLSMTNWTSRPRVWVPSNATSKVVILHQGHSGNYTSYNYQVACQAYLNAGIKVVGMVMPGGDELTSGTGASHNANAYPLATFIGPIIVTHNTVAGTGTNVYINGLSGGGWSATVAGACDSRFSGVFSCAGTFPLEQSPSRDHEQYLPGLRASWYDLYVLAALPSRKFWMLHHTSDDCCFGRSEYAAGIPFDNYIGPVAQSLGGTFSLQWFTKTNHAFYADVTSNIIVQVLQ